MLGQLETVEYLVAKGADINDYDLMGRTALMEAVNSYSMDVVEFLVKHGANVNQTDHQGCTALMRAAYTGIPSLVQTLLHLGADRTIRDHNDKLAIHYVRKECFEDLKGILA